MIDFLIIGILDELNCFIVRGDRFDFNFIKSREKIKSYSFFLRVGVIMLIFIFGGNVCFNMFCFGIMFY